MSKYNSKKLFEKLIIGSSMFFFHEVFDKNGKPEDALTTSEVFSMEVIYYLGRPTVNQFARYLHLTSPNAAYKVNHLVKKGYLSKTQSLSDKRVYYLEPTEKYLKNYAISRHHIDRVYDCLEERLTEEEWSALEHALKILSQEQARAIEQYDVTARNKSKTE